MKTLLTLVLVAWCPLVSAITVNVYTSAYPTCNYPNGTIHAVASGGVGPYTFLWNTGATTDVLTGVAPGTYSVIVTDANSDQATDDIILSGVPYALTDLGENGPQGLCNSGITGVVLQGPGLDPFLGTFMGPTPYLLNGQPMQEFIYDDGFGSPIDTFHVWSGSTTQYGMTVTYTFEDGTGCTGTVQEYIGYPVEWPQLDILDIQGACSNGSNGTVTFQTGLEGHGQFTQVKLTDLNSHYLNSVGAGDQVYTNTFTLPPGDYLLTQFMSESPFLVSSGCNLSTPFTIPDLGSGCGNIRGTVFMDNNENCTWQGGEPGVTGVVLEILPGPVYTITNGGQYSVNLPLGAYTLEQQSAVLDDHCLSAPAPFTLAVGNALQTLNVADTALVPLDARVVLASGAARPGFPLALSALLSNLTMASTGASSLSLTFDPALSFISASPMPTVSNNTLTWNIGAFSSFQQRVVHVQLQVPPDIGLLGTDLHFNATLTTGNVDVLPDNNAAALTTVVTGSYDPNDKTARTSTQSSERYLIDTDEWIDYTIRFQNTGTDTAFNVVITDTIPAQLDLATFEPGAASHANSLSIRDGNVLRWAFHDIQLPDSNVNEPRSHGFVSFRIKPRLPLLPGEVLSNIANIYFDFNPPVITEPSVLVAEFSTGVAASGTLDQQLIAIADLTQGTLRLSAPGHTLIDGLLRDMNGRIVLHQALHSDAAILNVSALASGAYIAEVHTTHGHLLRTKVLLTR